MEEIFKQINAEKKANENTDPSVKVTNPGNDDPTSN
jgi:hypothetical protein